MSTLMPGTGEMRGEPVMPRQYMAARLGPAETDAEADARRADASLEDAVERSVRDWRLEVLRPPS
jgi:hypothetical protein